MRKSSALVAFAERTWVAVAGANRALQARQVTQRLLVELADLCRAHGARFGVVLLRGTRDVRSSYATFLRWSGIPVADCAHRFTVDRVVRGEGHPNETSNAMWADCISRTRAIGRLVRELSGSE